MLPVLQVLSEDPYGIFCLVLTPTRYGAAPGGLGPGRPVPEGPGRPRLSSILPGRELAYQIAEQFRVLGKPLGLKDCVVVGGLGEWSEPPPGPGAAGLGGSPAEPPAGASRTMGLVVGALRSCFGTGGWWE